MTEDHPTFPCTVYGGSKLAGEAYTRAFYRTYGYPTVVVRPFNTYGPRSHHEGDSGEVIPKFLLRCLAGKPMVIFGDGTQTRDFTYVSDSARGIILAGTTDGGDWTDDQSRQRLRSDRSTTWRAPIAQIAERPDAEVVHDEPRPGDVLRLYADMSQARSLLGYEPQVRAGGRPGDAARLVSRAGRIARAAAARRSRPQLGRQSGSWLAVGMVVGSW